MAPMISSISQRSPRKTCGLFDIGFAGGNLDVTSLHLTDPADLIDNPFSLEGYKSVIFNTSDPLNGEDDYDKLGGDSAQPYSMDPFDMLDPLGDLETDQLMDDSLDAFVNLDQFLMGGTFFDEAAEVKPFIDIPEINNMTLTALDTDVFLTAEEPPTVTKPQRKRKAVEAVRTSLFEIPVTENFVTVNSELDHDYTAKHRKMSASPGNDNSKVNNKKSEKIMIICEPSTSSNITSSTKEFPQDKQTARRIKNNVASKKSREQRKQKLSGLDEEAETLVLANEDLRRQIIELEKTAKEMKALLVAKMAGN